MEMQNAIKRVDPRKRVEVSGFHMNQVAKSVQLIRSETYLTELMETICKYYYWKWPGALFRRKCDVLAIQYVVHIMLLIT